ncbi:MAG: hypothetical protein C0501_26240 [Isosphaera sp.]|nr:hypothetical protein [Isosphaera sp.]
MDDLAAIEAALTPFAADGLSKFAEFLKAAEEYKRTGILKAGGGRSTAGSAATPPDALKKQIGELYEKAASASEEQIERTLAAVAHKDVQLDALKQLAAVVGAEGKAKSLRAKDKVVAVIREAITLRRAMADRRQQ